MNIFKRLKAPTPKLISHIGTALSSAALTACGISFVTDHKVWGGILLGAAFVGKFVAELFVSQEQKSELTQPKID